MMANDTAYVIFRRRPDGSVGPNPFDNGNNTTLFGWSESKAAIETFRLQRDPDKYRIRKVHIDDINELGGRRTADDLQLDLINLKSNRLKRDVPFMTTAGEKTRFEAGIRQLFSDACCIGTLAERKDVDLTLLVISLANLKPAYAEALEMIGYRNTELNSVFDSVDDDNGCMDYDRTRAGYGITVGQVIIYSLESVIKVLIDEM